MFDTLGTLVRLQKISNQLYTAGDEINKLRSHISKWSIQSV